MGTLFREEEFNRALQDGALSTLPIDERQLVTRALPQKSDLAREKSVLVRVG